MKNRKVLIIGSSIILVVLAVVLFCVFILDFNTEKTEIEDSSDSVQQKEETQSEQIPRSKENDPESLNSESDEESLEDFEDKVFEEKDYSDALTDEQKKMMQTVIYSLYVVQAREEMFREFGQEANCPERLPTSLDDPILLTEDGLYMAIEDMMTWEPFVNWREHDSVSKEKMDQFCKSILDISFDSVKESESNTKWADWGDPSDDLMRYVDGEYVFRDAEDVEWTPYEGVVISKLLQNASDEVQITATIMERDFETEQLAPKHTVMIKTKISSESPMGLTIVGMVYDDPISEDNEDGSFLDSAEYLLPESATRCLSRNELEHYSKEELRLARNEIYARHGRKFQSEDLQDYFNKQSWYNGTIEANAFSDSLLNSYELENATLIKELEDAK